MNAINPFEQEWRECLRAHYIYVVRSGDEATERTLTSVMEQAGFDSKTMVELRIRATLRAEELPADFVPDFAALEEQLAAQVLEQAAKAVEMTAPEETMQPVIAVPDGDGEAQDKAPAPSEEYYAPPDDTPQQLTLF
jgi:hypothetical protein